MLIATITALLLMGGSGASWTLDQVATIKAQIKSVVEDDIQRKQLLDIAAEMKSISKRFASNDRKASKTINKLVMDYDGNTDEIGALILQSNLERHRYQQEMLAERFRMVEATDDYLWAKLFPQPDAAEEPATP